MNKISTLMFMFIFFLSPNQDIIAEEEKKLINEILTTTKPYEFRLRIAVIDTGMSQFQIDKPYMCKDKSNVSLDGITRFDSNGHGTNVIGLIGDQIDTSKYCITSYAVPEYTNMSKYLEMLSQIYKDTPHALNISWASPGYSYEEFSILKEYTERRGIIVSVAAGNRSQYMTEDNCDMFPSCYGFKLKKNFYVIGSVDKHGRKKFSNFGENVTHYVDGNKKGFPQKTGTSQSTAIFTGRLFSK